MEYVIEILKSKLRHELQSKAEAEQYLEGIHGVQSKYSDRTVEAFRESQRLALERIPQLESALGKLQESDHP